MCERKIGRIQAPPANPKLQPTTVHSTAWPKYASTEEAAAAPLHIYSLDIHYRMELPWLGPVTARMAAGMGHARGEREKPGVRRTIKVAWVGIEQEPACRGEGPGGDARLLAPCWCGNGARAERGSHADWYKRNGQRTCCMPARTVPADLLASRVEKR